MFLWTALLRICRLNLDLTNSKTDPPVFRQRRSVSVLTEVGSWVSGRRNRHQDAHTTNCRVTWVWTFSWRCIEVAEVNTMIFIPRYKEQAKWPISCMLGWLQMATWMVLVDYLCDNYRLSIACATSQRVWTVGWVGNVNKIGESTGGGNR